MIGLVKTKEEFLQNSLSDLLDELLSLYPDAGGSQITSWRNLIRDLYFDPLFNALPNDVVLGLEYFLPIEGMGVDLFMAGNDKKGKKILYLIEAKLWGDAYVYETKFGSSRYGGLVLHPQIQIYRHYLAVKNYLSIGCEFDEIRPILYLGGCTSRGNHLIQKQCYDPNAAKVPIFNTINDVLSGISSELTDGSGFSPDMFISASYFASVGIVDAMKSIVKNEQPFILTESQENAAENIKKAINNDGKKIIRVVGSGGSGKTAILINLFVSYLNSGSHNAYFSPGAQNFKLYKSLYPEIENVFSSTYGLRNLARRGQFNSNTILFLDEAQHNEEGLLSVFLRTGCVVVVCYDDKQVINLTNSAIEELKRFESRSDFIGIELKESVRFNGSSLFEPNIRCFLNGGTEFKDDANYDFRIFTSLDDIIDSGIRLITDNPNATVAFTGLLSNDADDIIRESRGRLKTDWEQPYGGIPAETRWIPYVLKKNYLANPPIWVGTWWSPGLDFDYVIVIVGGDAIMTPDGIIPVPEQTKHFKMMISIGEKMGIPMYGNSSRKQCESLIDYLNYPANALEKVEFFKKFKKLLTDNYYIMLTRGRKGCYVYFENNKNKY